MNNRDTIILKNNQFPSNTFIVIISLILLIYGFILRYITLKDGNYLNRPNYYISSFRFYNIIKDGNYYGSEHIFFYLLLTLVLLYIAILTLDLAHIKAKILAVFILWKIPLAMGFLYITMTRYLGGDFHLYYEVPALCNRDNSAFFLKPLSDTNLISYFNYQFFRIMPISIFGLVLIYALLSFIAFLILYKIFKEYTQWKGLLFILLFLLPSIAMQSSYVGKEGVILCCICVMFFIIDKYSLSNNKERIWLLIFLLITVMLIYKIRVYQFLMIINVLIGALFYRAKGLKRVFILTVIIGIIGINILFIKNRIMYGTTSPSEFAQYYPNHEYSLFSIKDFINIIYLSGSLMLKPYPFPFQLLQIFRPFLWETNSLFSHLNSIELTLLLIFYVGCLIKNFSLIKTRISTIPVYTVLAFYSLISIFAFSFDPNMGDLSRRRSYVIPFLSILLLK